MRLLWVWAWQKKRTSNAQQMAPLDFMSLQIYRLSDVCKLIKLKKNRQKDHKTNVEMTYKSEYTVTVRLYLFIQTQ